MKIREILGKKGVVMRMSSEETDLREAVRMWNGRNIKTSLNIETAETISPWRERGMRDLSLAFGKSGPLMGLRVEMAK